MAFIKKRHRGRPPLSGELESRLELVEAQLVIAVNESAKNARHAKRTSESLKAAHELLQDARRA